MIALDASVVIAHFDTRDVHHAASTAVLTNAVDEPLVVHPLTLAEVLVAAVRAGKEMQVQADLTAIGVRPAEEAADEPLRLARLRVSTHLKLPDCCVLDVAMRHRARLATFDGPLAAAARDLGLVVLGGR